MNPTAVVAAGIAVLLAGGATASAARAGRLASRALFLVSTLGGCALLALGAILAIRGAAPAAVDAVWPVPGGALRLRADALGAWFVLVVALVGAPVAVHSLSYLAGIPARPWGAFAFLFNLLLAALAIVAIAQSGLLFLAGWETLTLAAYFLIVLIHEKESVRFAGRLYFVANHLGAFCLLALVALLADGAGSLDFEAMAGSSRTPAAPGWLLLGLAIVGFGTKAGAIPFHIWLPHAHPAAPTPISAILSGLVVKSGIFGLLRFLPLLGPLPPGTGTVLLGLGIASGVLGVLYALGQHDLKRLLAYHTVENIGIMLLGIGAGVLGVASNSPEVAVLGFAGALLHLFNHAVFKALLFLGAGSVIHAAGTGDADRLGGLSKTMPQTAALFLVGCVSICGLPPFNGFVSEWTVFRALFSESVSVQNLPRLASTSAVLALALVGGLAVACFAKVFGTVFLGERRDPGTREPGGEASRPQRGAMAFLAALCLAAGVLPQVALAAVWPAASAVARNLGLADPPPAAMAAAWLGPVSTAALLLIGLSVVLAVVRQRLAPAKTAPRVPTWGCGYSRPTPRMQYTASSFARPLLLLFRSLVPGRSEGAAPEGLFPRAPERRTWIPDALEDRVFRPAFDALVRACLLLRRLQRGPVQFQVLTVMLAVAVLLLWKVAF